MSSNRKNNTVQSKKEWLIIVIAIFILRITPWLLSEYWYDEVLTLGEFSLDTRGLGLWKAVFRTYPIANNHILSSAIYWCWVRILGFTLDFEQFTRLPSVIFGCGLISLCVCHWRKWLGARMANLGGLLLAVSPVYTAYAYQIRGYSLSMFLCGVALSGLLEYNSGRNWRGQILMCLACLLLPLTIPSNILFSFVLICTLLFSCKTLRSACISAVAPVFFSLLGISYYFTIWKQFVVASREPGGWDSAWAVAGNLLLAFAVHGLALLIPLGLSMLQKNKPQQLPQEANVETEQTAAKTYRPISPLVITLSTIVAIAGTLLFSRSGQAPYPRVFLVLFISVSFALYLSCARRHIGTRSFALLFVAILFAGLVSERVSSEMTDRELSKGISPNNLLQQYYRGNDDLRTMAEFMRRGEVLEKALIITDEYDFPTMRMYVMLNGGNASQVVTRNTVKSGFLSNLEDADKVMVCVIAKTPDIAGGLLDFSGLKATPENPFKLYFKYGARAMYVPQLPEKASAQ